VAPRRSPCKGCEMYGWIWRTLPGGRPGKVLGSFLLLAAVIALLFLYVFPALEPLLPFSDVTVDTDQAGVLLSAVGHGLP
ncbi:MAG: hypothetical protein M4D85_07670, partial [Actinomycetota bacterium]|nr:hypothetical protein [Actinomycetota bacterium]